MVKPNSKIAADGVVVKGTSPENQASITGESTPVDKHPNPNWQNENEINKLLPEHRVTIYNVASSQKSLSIMLTIVVIGTPLLAGYFIFLYKTFYGKVT